MITESSASLYTSKSNPGDRVLGEVEKDSFIALPGKGEHTGLLPRKTMCPNPRGSDEGFYNKGSKVGLLTRRGCEQGLRWSPNLHELLWSLESCLGGCCCFD